MIHRLRAAAANVLARPALWWVIAAAFWLRVLVLTALVQRRPDAEGMWEGAYAYLHNPAHMYDAAAAYLARLHIIAPPGTMDDYVNPPPSSALGVPIALLPKSVGVQVWTAIDGLAVVVALLLLYRLLATRHPLG